ncbi:hypothetical protein CCHR01_19811 [Colletotrichum chrysophilum]|uniref:Uncharacterized protein n=1 Tax=Colletotrichum chrysophilum TaxID=1836956 RepID=A0AAD8ZXY0_9PEZI|nr:hypothetical protein CCHR01_19811 [Colletotrichum chrysophilum]
MPDRGYTFSDDVRDAMSPILELDEDNESHPETTVNDHQRLEDDHTSNQSGPSASADNSPPQQTPDRPEGCEYSLGSKPYLFKLCGHDQSVIFVYPEDRCPVCLCDDKPMGIASCDRAAVIP